MHFVKKTVLGFLVALLCGAAWCGVAANGHAGARRVNHLTRVSSHGRIAVKAEGNRFSESAKVSFSRTRADGVKRRIMEGLAKKRRGGPRLLGAAKEPSSRKEPSVLAMYDISIESDGAKWQPAAGEPVQVDVTLDEPVAIADAAKLAIAHMADDGTVEELSDSNYSFTYNADKTAVTAFWFNATGFSIYTIIETGGIIDSDGTLVKPRRFYHFYAHGDVFDESTMVRALPYKFLDEAGDTVNIEIAKDGDFIKEPPIPPDLFDTTGDLQSMFRGWYVIKKTRRPAGAAENKLDPDDPPFEFVWPDGVTENRISFTDAVSIDDNVDMDYWVAPLYEHARFVQFNENDYSDADNIVWRIIDRKLVAINDDSGWKDVMVSDVSAALKNNRHEYFCGWRYKDANGQFQELLVYSSSGHPQEQYIRVDDELFEANGGISIPLYPVYVSAHFLNFDTNAKGSGATYVGSIFVRSTSDFSSVTPSGNRPGYDFAGWCAGTVVNGKVVLGTRVTDASGSFLPNVSVSNDENEVIFYTDASGNIRLNKDVTLYASWTANTSAPYRVIVWQQRVTDDKNATDAQKKYYYVTHYTSPAVPATTQVSDALFTNFTGTRADGASISAKDLSALSGKAENNAANEDFTGFHYSRYGSDDQTIAADGSTVVNVYYDRNLITYVFRLYDSANEETTYTQTTGTSGTQYGTENGTDYFEIYYSDGQWYKTMSGNVFTGTRYRRRWTGSYQETTSGYDTYPTQYRKVGNNYYELYYANGNWYVEAPSYSDPYSGNRFTVSTSHWIVDHTMTGIYGQTLEAAGYEWPIDHWWYANGSGTGGTSGTRTTFRDAFLPPVVTATQETFYGNNVDASATRVVSFYKQSIDGNSYILANSVISESSGFNITDKYNGFTAYQYCNDGGSWQSVGTKGSNGYYSASPSYRSTLDIRNTRNKYELIYKDGDATVYDTGKNVPYESPLADYDLPLTDSRLNWGSRDLSIGTFEGWYEDASLTVPFDFTATMPDGKKFLYAKWAPVKYKVIIDPNGGEMQSGDSTWFYLDAGEKLLEYAITRNYVLDMRSGTFYYHHDLWDPVKDKHTDQYDPSTEGAPRLAYYTEDVTQATDNEVSNPGNLYSFKPNAYAFMGWYEVLEDGSLATDPFSFNDPPNRPVTIRALWRRMDEYVLHFESIDPDGSEPDQVILDPVSSVKGGYIDEGETTIAKAPTNYSKDDWLWEGWQVVDTYNNNIPLTTIRSPGDIYVVRAAHADREGIIHFRAVYKQIGDGSSKHVPPVTDLILDSNDNAGLVENPSISVQADRIGMYTDGTAGSVSGLNQGVWFAGQLNNFSVNLADYSSAFKHNNGYRLLGWDPMRNPGTLVPKYYANETIGMDKLSGSENILYAVWEPQIYIEFVNNTGEALSNIKLNIPAWAEGNIYRVNSLQDSYQRVEFTSFQNGEATINLAVGETLCLVLPDAAEKAFIVSGTCGFTEGSKLSILKTEPSTQGGETVQDVNVTAYPSESYNVTGTMKIGSEPARVIFTKEPYDTTIDVPVRYFIHDPDGSVTEITNDPGSWSPFDDVKKTLQEIGDSANDIAVLLRKSATEGVHELLSSSLREQYGYMTIGIGKAASEEEPNVFEEWQSMTNGESSGGPYLKFFHEELRWSRFAQSESWSSHENGAVYVVFYKRIPVPITVGKMVEGTDEDKSPDTKFNFSVTYTQHSVKVEYTKTITKTKTRTLESNGSSQPNLPNNNTVSNDTDDHNPDSSDDTGWIVGTWSDVDENTEAPANVKFSSDETPDLFPARNESPSPFDLSDGGKNSFNLYYSSNGDGVSVGNQTRSSQYTHTFSAVTDNGKNGQNKRYYTTQTVTWQETVPMKITYQYETAVVTETSLDDRYTLTRIGDDPGDSSDQCGGVADIQNRTYTISSINSDSINPVPGAVAEFYSYHQPDSAIFTNTRKAGKLAVSKTVNGAKAGDESDKFKFVVTLGETVIDKANYQLPTGVTMDPTGHTLTFELTADDSITLLNLPAGASYDVQENENSKYYIASGDMPANKTGEIVAGDTATTVAYVNTRKEDLAVAINDVAKDFTGDEQFGYDITTETGISGEITKTEYTVTGLREGHVLTVQHHVPARGTAVGSYMGNFDNARITVKDADGVDVTDEYIITSTPGSLTINVTPIIVTVTGNHDEKTYNGEDQSCQGYEYVITHGTTGARIENDNIHVAVNSEYQTAWRKDVGRGEMHLQPSRVVVTAPEGFTISDKVVAANGYIDITPAQATVKADDKDKILGCSEPALTATLSGLFGDDTVSYTLARESGEAVGTYTITPTVTSSDNPNYVVTPVNGTFTIGTPALIQRANGEALPIESGLSDRLLAQFAADAGDAARSWTISSLQDYLNEWQPNELRRWENFRLGTEKNQQLLDTAVGAGATQLTASMAEGPKTIIDFSYDVQHVLRRYVKGENGEWSWVHCQGPVKGAYPKFANPQFTIDLLDASGNSKGAAGYYRVYTQIIPKAKTAIVNEIPSANIIGVLEVNSSVASTMTAVPWLALPSDPAAKVQISAAGYVNKGQLGAGDAIYAMGEGGVYSKWTLDGGAWTPWSTVADSGSDVELVAAPDPSKARFAYGSAVWVERATRTKPYFLVGQYTSADVVVQVAGGKEDAPAFTMIANHNLTAIKVNDIDWGSNPVAAEGTVVGDKIQIPTDTSVPLTLSWRKDPSDSEYKWGKTEFNRTTRRSEWRFDYTIPAGVGFWYISRGGGFTVTVPSRHPDFKE